MTGASLAVNEFTGAIVVSLMTHQFRLLPEIPVYPPISFRAPLDFPETLPIEEARLLVTFSQLDNLAFDSTRLLATVTTDRCILSEIEGDEPMIRLVTSFGNEILDHAWCGNDLFLLYAGDGGLRKFTLFTTEKAVEKLVFKQAFKQAARVALKFPNNIGMEQLDGIFEGLQQISRSHEVEMLLRLLRQRFKSASPHLSMSPSSPLASVARQSPSLKTPSPLSTPKIESRRKLPVPSYSDPLRANSQRLTTGIHRVINDRLENSGYDDDFVFRLASPPTSTSRPAKRILGLHRHKVHPLRERSKSASPAPDPSRSQELGNERRGSVERQQTPDVLRQARNLLETRGSSVPEIDSLRTLLGLDAEDSRYETIQFTPTVTLASAPRKLAELAQTVPIDIVETLKVERRTIKPVAQRHSSRESLSSAGSASKKPTGGIGPRIVKTVRPVKGGIAVAISAMPRRVEVRTEAVNSENPIVRFDVTTSVKGTPLNRVNGTAHFPEKLAEEEKPFNHCPNCRMHRSWLAVALLIPCVGRVSVAEQMEDGSVPRTLELWMRLLSHRLLNTPSPFNEPVSPCSDCQLAISVLAKTFGRQASPQKGDEPVRKSECERLRRRALAIADEEIVDIFFGQLHREPKILEDEPPSEVKPLEPPPPTEDGFMSGVPVSLLLSICVCCFGVEALCDQLAAPKWHRLAEALSPDDWATLTSIQTHLGQMKVRGYLMPIQAIRAVMKEHRLLDYVRLEAQSPEKEIAKPNQPSNRRLVTTKPVVVKSWIADLTRSCPLCTLPLRTIVGGVDAGVATYFCGHSFHAVCASGNGNGSSSARNSPVRGTTPTSSKTEETFSTESLTIPDTCIACRIRLRAMNAAVAQAKR
ncbi:unnamed protein product, partial [Mesorhabditis spiculigera]